ncbi:DUF2141 domain-containing protein [Altererythrobacter sp. KTW20L]|jgi:uncharacterized protein (DUF2141 family)|uniref:DUF2141 domain-containing protein n=1 Tax=Altererythrobacter sp. KTW20L TaxID=2942210 RepID=UPI0020BFC124|nr:DUF2141 domain-containing protein [Altererythrobacter sp. KTW20L]MCL6250260.1 DUF2141 domain-containing protein [Altererythrobacter sp. KTW20L]
MHFTFRRALPALAVTAAAAGMLATATPALAYQQEIRNDPARCRGAGPAVRVNVSGIESSSGNMRVQIYHGTREDWLTSGKWLYRIEVPARAGSMTFCLPVPSAGSYAVAVRHDVNGNDRTDIRTDGGAMSNNPSINILNLGRPSVNRTRFDVSGVTTINVNMRYM